MKTNIVLAATIALLLGTSVAMAGPGFNNKYSVDEVTVACTDDNDNVVGTVTYGGPLKMWPPNHKMEGITITARAVDADDTVELATEGTHDEFQEDGEEMVGAGNTDTDVNPPADSDGPAAGVAETAHDLRSERSGRGDGRVYTLDWQAKFTDSDMDGTEEQGSTPYIEVVCGSADLDMSGFEPNADAFLVEVPHDMRCGADWKGGNNGNGGNGQCGG